MSNVIFSFGNKCQSPRVAELLDVWFTPTKVRYHDNSIVLIPLNQYNNYNIIVLGAKLRVTENRCDISDFPTQLCMLGSVTTALST